MIIDVGLVYKKHRVRAGLKKMQIIDHGLWSCI